MLRADLRSRSAVPWRLAGRSGQIEAHGRRPARGSAQSLHTGHFWYTPRPAGCRSRGLPLRKTQRLSARRRRSRPISRVLSRTIIHLRYASPRTSSDLPGSTCGPHARPRPKTTPPAPLFGLAPGGVCHAAECCHRRGALLPHPFTLTAPFAGGLAVCFLLHFPWARAPQALPGAVPWEPGLSSTLARSDCLADSGADGGVDRPAKQGAGREKRVKLSVAALSSVGRDTAPPRCCGAEFHPFFSPGTFPSRRAAW